MTAGQGWRHALQAFPARRRSKSQARVSDERAVGTRALALAAAAMLGLLLALGLVVQNIVHQAATRHADTAAQSNALWRCNTVTGREAREECRRVAGEVRHRTLSGSP